MKQILRLSPRVGIASLAALFSIAALEGCTGSGDGGVASFEPAATAHPSAAASPIVVEGKLLVYLASEALSGVGGTSFNTQNGDNDTGDDCAVVVDMTTETETDLNVATLAARILGANVYLMVSEAADNKDWNLDGPLDDTVLLHFSSSSPLSFVDEIEPGAHSWAVAGGRFYYVRGDTSGVVNGQTSLAFLATTAPKTPVSVLHTDAGNTLFPNILGVDEDLIFLTADEVVEGRDLNGDTVADDLFVLALLDGTDIAGVVQNVELSLASDSSPVRAHKTGSNDWNVGFLVDEASQSNFLTGLNDPVALGFGAAWKPSNCPGYADTDLTDQVLHVLSYALWAANPVLDPPENTGIPGTARVLCTSDAVATLVKETDEGGVTGCDLNNDGDTADRILRWALVAQPQLPFGTDTQLNAVEDATPGGTSGITDLDDRFLSVVSENKDNTDHDGDTLKTHNLVAWIDPNAGVPVWVFDHGPQGGFQAAGASAMSDRPERDRLLVAFQESVFGQSINSGGDNDTLDSSPTFARFDPSDPNDLDFPGPAIAVAAANPGIVIAEEFAIYRVDEAADNRDWNGDNVKNDFVLFRTTLSSNFSSVIGFNVRSTANNLSGPVIVNSGPFGAAFLASEAMAGQDLNVPTDGRQDGFVVTWFRIGS